MVLLSITFALLVVLAASAPILPLGVWTNISPAGINFNNDKDHPIFTQGITLDPSNPDVLYLSVSSYDVFNGGLWKSSDRGSTWTKIGLGKYYHNTTLVDEPIRVRVDPKNPLHLYVADGVRGDCMGFWVSTDGGKTLVMPTGFLNWVLTIGVPDVYDCAPDPADFNHVLLAFHNPWRSTGAGVAESLDGGETWISHYPPPGSNWYAGMSVAFLGNSATWLLGSQGQGYWRTANSGATWTQVSTTNIQHGGGNSYRAKSGVLYASGSPKNIRSTDNGVTWTPVGPGMYSGYNSIWGDGNLLYAAPFAGPTPFVTSPESDGLTWSNYNSQQFTVGPFEMTFDSRNGILYGGMWYMGLYALRVNSTSM